MAETDESIRKIVNSSGFPFQLWIAKQIEQTSEHHSWKVVGLEFRWFDKRKQKEEFIDVVLEDQNDVFRAVIEAKRVRNGTWIFLQPLNFEEKTRSFRYMWIDASREKIGWHDGYFEKELPVSSFCIIRSQAQNQPMLERVASYVLAATESVGERELLLHETKYQHIYLPIIVTTAKLLLYSFDPANVDPITGTPENGLFSEVPYLVFRKGFDTTYETSKMPSNLTELNSEDERTVLVVNSLHLKELLIHINAFKLINRYESFPWE